MPIRHKSRAKPKSSRMGKRQLADLLSSTNLVQKNIDTSGTGIKPFTRSKQMYAQRIQMGDGLAAPYPYKFRLNSTFDPDETGTGHQPRGRDELAAIYNDYTVIGCKYKVTFINAGTADVWVWAHVDSDSSSDIVSFEDALERGSSVKKVLLAPTNDGYQNRRVIKSGKLDLTKYAVPTGGSIADQFRVGVGANPSTSVRLHLQAATQSGGAIATNAIVAFVELEMDVIYSTPAAVFSS